MKIRVTNGMELAIAPNEAKKRGHPVFLIHAEYPYILDEKARRGWGQYPALKYYPDGEVEFIEAAPRIK